MIFPRTGEIAKPGQLSMRGALQVVSLEPQTVVETTGSKASSTVGFFPDWNVEGHVGFGRCETGLVLVDFGLLAELRCGLLRQDHGDPFSLAISGAAGAATSFAIGPAPAARFGIDVSHRFGPGIEPLVDVYLSTARQGHFVQTGWVNDPVVAPSGDAMGQQEIRLSIPIGVAFVDRDKNHRPFDPTFRSVIVGFEPWFILAHVGRVEIDPIVASYQTGYGFAFTVGLSFR
jgi:hypothetical protein